MVCDHGCCGWCGPSALCPGGWCPQVWSCGRLVPGMLDGKVVHNNVSQLIRGCLEWLGHKFS